MNALYLDTCSCAAATTPTHRGERMYCKKCGKEIDDDSLFCSKCGAKQSSNESVTTFIPASTSVQHSGRVREMCEIQWEAHYPGVLSVVVSMVAYSAHWIAVSIGPKGREVIASSPTFRYNSDISEGGGREGEWAFNELVQTLVRDGWEPLGAGYPWWNHRFQRYVLAKPEPPTPKPSPKRPPVAAQATPKFRPARHFADDGSQEVCAIELIQNTAPFRGPITWKFTATVSSKKQTYVLIESPKFVPDPESTFESSRPEPGDPAREAFDKLLNRISPKEWESLPSGERWYEHCFVRVK